MGALQRVERGSVIFFSLKNHDNCLYDVYRIQYDEMFHNNACRHIKSCIVFESEQPLIAASLMSRDRHDILILYIIISRDGKLVHVKHLAALV